MFNPNIDKLGKFALGDGTIDFYLRVRSVIHSDCTVVDLGAGRAAWFEDDQSEIRKNIRHLKPDVGELIAVDVDEAVLSNRSSTRNMLYDGKILPMEDSSADVIVADYVLEHVQDPGEFSTEIRRVLKPGGYFCARTPHKWNYASIGARMISNSRHGAFLSKVQPHRKEMDIFPTAYKLNTIRAIKSTFEQWDDMSYLFRQNPPYYFGKKTVYSILSFLHRLSPIVLVANVFVFLKKT